MLEMRNQHEVVETLEDVFVKDHGRLDRVEVRIAWTESRTTPDATWKGKGFYLRAYHDGKIVQHIFKPFASKGAAKRHAPDFVGAIKEFTRREERARVSSGGRPELRTDRPAPPHWAT